MTRKRIVVAEDDSATRMILAKLLHKNNYSVTAVDNGRSACEVVFQENPDIVLLDWHMPIMNGYDAIKILTTDARSRFVPIIMLTTECHIEEKELILKSGAQDYINKPFDPRDLLARIESTLHWQKNIHAGAQAGFALEKKHLVTKNEQRYRRLAEAMSSMILIADPGGEFTFCNQRWTEYTKLRNDDLREQILFSILHPDDLVQTKQLWHNAIATGVSCEKQLRCRREVDGSYRLHHARFCAIYDEHKEFLEWICTFVDVQDRRLAEETCRMLDTIQHMITVSSGQGCVEYINAQWCQYTGLSLPESSGLHWTSAVHPEDRTTMAEHNSFDVNAASPPFECELRLRDHRGEYRWFLSRSAILKQPEAVFPRLITTYTDIQEQKRAHQEISSLYARESRTLLALKQAFNPTAPPSIPGLSIDVAYSPLSKAHVGGDWYDLQSLPDGRIFFSIGDVSGHGIDAALVMVRVRQALLSLGIHAECPAKVLEQVNAMLVLQEAQMVTAICGYINQSLQEIILSVAGHPSPIIAYPGKIPALLDVHGMGMGVYVGLPSSSVTIEVEPGSTFIMYTDGVTEIHQNIIEGEKRLLDVTREGISDKVPQMAQYLHSKIFAEHHATDDTTIVAISFF